jgi:contact-dependent growth inhibition (CDI) system CdiI-like immunity protein
LFWIGFINEPLVDAEPGEMGRVGLLKLRVREERFVSHFETWSVRDYYDHWRDALLRALAGKPSALIVDMQTPARSSHLIWWPVWKVCDELVFHNQLLLFERHGIEGSHLDLERLFSLIGERKSHNAEGMPISEWYLPASDAEKFLVSRGKP